MSKVFELLTAALNSPPPPFIFLSSSSGLCWCLPQLSNYLLKAGTELSAGAKQAADYRAACLCAASITAEIKR